MTSDITDRFDAVFFDMDGTLVNTEPASIEGVRLYMEELGVKGEPGFEMNVVGKSWLSMVRLLQTTFDLTLSEDEILAELVRQKEKVVHLGIPILPNARECLEFCKGLGLHVAVVSGSTRSEISHVLDLLDAHGFVDFYMGVGDYERSKPDPDPFLRAAARVGVSPERCLTFEDSPGGIGSAKAAGMTCIGISIALMEGLSQDEADTIIQTLPGTPEELGRILARVRSL